MPEPSTTLERWLPVVGWEGIYEVSDQGRVKRVKKGANGKKPGLLKGGKDRNGYPVVALCSPGRYRYVKIHRLVGEAFLGQLPDGMETRHLNGNPADPRLSNLAYGTHVENMRDKEAHGTTRRHKVKSCPQGHGYDEANTYWDGRGNRNCRTCLRIKARREKRKAREAARAAGVDRFFAVRQWGSANGWDVKPTGRISNALLNAYDEAQRIETRTQRAAA